MLPFLPTYVGFLISQRYIVTFKHPCIKQATFSVFSYQRTVSSVPPTVVGCVVAFDGYTIPWVMACTRNGLVIRFVGLFAVDRLHFLLLLGLGLKKVAFLSW